MPSSPRQRRNASPRDLFFDLLTFDRRLAVPVMHLVYWAGLGLIALFAFAVVGAALGVSLKEGWQGLLIGIPTLVAGFLIVGAMVLIWRSFCEFYITIFKISEDLSAMRASLEAERGTGAAPAPAPTPVQEAARRLVP